MQAICSKCARPLPVLSSTSSGEYCCECGCVTPFDEGIYRFVQPGGFYEGRFIATHGQVEGAVNARSFLRSISIDGNEERTWREITKYLKERNSSDSFEILNIGAGGGHEFLATLGSVTAVDISFRSLINARGIYGSCYQADARHLPFRNDSFDLVFSSHVLGHIPLSDKQQVIREIYRVTKPGGYSLHSVECEADNFVYRRAKKHPELFNRYFVKMFGHDGLERPSSCMARFRQESFEPIFERPDYCKGVIRPIGSYKVFFGAQEYRSKDWVLNLLAWFSLTASRSRRSRVVADVLLYPLSLLNRIGGQDGVDSAKLFYRK